MSKQDLIPTDADIIFYTHNKEVLRLCKNGDLMYKGKVTTDEKDLVRGLREFLIGIQEGKKDELEGVRTS